MRLLFKILAQHYAIRPATRMFLSLEFRIVAMTFIAVVNSARSSQHDHNCKWILLAALMVNY